MDFRFLPNCQMNLKKIIVFITRLNSRLLSKNFSRFLYYYDRYNARKSKRQLGAFLNKHYPNFSIVLYDLGAAGGIDPTYQPLQELAHFQAIGFDPDKEDISKIKGNTKTTFYPCGIAGTNGTRDFYITNSPGCSSIYPPCNKNLIEFPVSDIFEVERKTKIEVLTLASFIEKFTPPSPDFFKADVQGAELEVLKSEGAWLENVVGLSFETHLRELYIGQGLFHEIHIFLSSQGFRLISQEGRSPHFSGETLEMDVAYIRGIEQLDTDEKLVKAIIFCVCHENPTYAAHLVRRSCLSNAKKKIFLKYLRKDYGFAEEPQTLMMMLSLKNDGH